MRTRRQLLGQGALLALAATQIDRLAYALAPAPAQAATLAELGTPFAAPLPIPPTLTGSDIVLTAAPSEAQILPGAKTRLWTYNGTFPGPTIRRRSGEQTRVTLRNALPADAGSLTLHHHGGHQAAIHDGQPMAHTVPVGGERTYVYDLVEDGAPERAAHQWYHDHSHFRTGRNTWRGLAGMVILDDEFEDALDLPSGEFELPLLIADRAFDSDNQLSDAFFSSVDKESRGPADVANLTLPEAVGSVVLVNGAVQPHAEVRARRYRLRVLNASNFSPYNLALSDGADLVVIGTESGLLPKPVRRKQVLLGPGERADVIVDFTGADGRDVVLRSELVTGQRLPADAPKVADLVQFRVRGAAADDSAIPATLRPLPAWAAEVADTPDLERTFVFGYGVDDGGRYSWAINGRAYDMNRVDAAPALGATETWTLVNASPKSHYIHMHGVDWIVVSRNGQAPAADSLETGLKETFRLDPGEVLVLGTKFTDHLGKFMIHCHMLEHEDHGMMATFEVVAPGSAAARADRRRRSGTRALTPQARTVARRITSAVRRRPGRPAGIAAGGRIAATKRSGGLLCNLK